MKTTSLSHLPRVVSNFVSSHSPTEAPSPQRAGHFDASSFEAGKSKQARGRRPTQTRAQRQAEAQARAEARARVQAHMTELTGSGSRRLRDMNPTPGPQNCPATAGAVDHFLRTGQVRAAGRGDNVVTYRFQNTFTDTTVAGLRQQLSQPGDHAVVRGLRDPALAEAEGISREHYFVVVNDQGTLRAVDAFTGRITPLSQLVDDEALPRLQVTSGPFNPVAHDPLAGDSVPGLEGAP